MAFLQKLTVRESVLDNLSLTKYERPGDFIDDPRNSLKDAKLNFDEALELAKVQTLRLVTAVFYDQQDITFLAKLNQIKCLIIVSNKCGSLKTLFEAIALEDDTELTNITIEEEPISAEEAQEIGKIQSLTHLECSFRNIASMEYLTNLQNLNGLIINSKYKLSELADAMLKFLVNTKSGDVGVYPRETCIQYTEDMRALSVDLTLADSPINTADCAQLVKIPNLRELVINGNQQDALLPLLKAFATYDQPTLQELRAYGYPFSCHEVAEIAKIKTLMYLDCTFKDFNSIVLLGQLPKLIRLYIPSIQDFQTISEGLLSILRSCQYEVTISRTALHCINWINNNGKLTITSDSYNRELLDARQYSCLAKLENIQHLRILGEHKTGSFKDLFQGMACSALQEVSIEQRKHYPNQVEINFEEIEALSKLKTLKRLTCGLAAAENTKQLALLSELQELTISTHQLGSLRNLFEAIANQKHPKLERLVIANVSLDPDECLQVSRITSLKKLELGISDGENIQIFSQLNQLEELTLTTHKLGTLATLFKALAALSIEYLNMEKVPLTLEETTALVGIRSLKKLQSGFEKSECIELLAELNCLKELTVLLDDTVELSFDALSQLQTLQRLTLKGVDINSKQAEEIAKIKSLSNLDCLFPHVNISGERTASELVTLFNELCVGQVPLRSLAVVAELTSNEIAELKKLKTLQNLKCGFSHENNFKILKHFKELETLEILSYHHFNDVSKHLLKLMKNCHKLKSIVFHFISPHISLKFLAEALDILKSVRDPNLQAPLQLKTNYFKGFTPEQLPIMDEAYLQISKFRDNDDF
ncbi:uncharacterized protein LOC108598677 [Drosophila busckii]|uniref:uncharacterized protein LOC108598677 n=1 Tax=Drosophila busckii TaxID=30019 RepID=UPI00083ECC59|nr:uncharacterized protein LOC108598677 [Drosophila busckii]